MLIVSRGSGLAISVSFCFFDFFEPLALGDLDFLNLGTDYFLAIGDLDLFLGDGEWSELAFSISKGLRGSVLFKLDLDTSSESMGGR